MHLSRNASVRRFQQIIYAIWEYAYQIPVIDCCMCVGHVHLFFSVSRYETLRCVYVWRGLSDSDYSHM